MTNVQYQLVVIFECLLYFTFSIRSDLNLRPSLICLLIVPVGLNKLLSAKIKGIFPVWIKGKKLFSEILQGRAIKEKMLNSFFYVPTGYKLVGDLPLSC